MPIIEDQPPRRDGRSSRPAQPQASTQPVVIHKEARSPRGLKAVYIDTLTHARATQAAAELGTDLNQLAQAAMTAHLKREAGALFEREFRAEIEKAEASRGITPQRWEFERSWRPPAWTRE